MSGVINCFEGTPDWESATHLKLCCETAVPINERIFALGQVSVSKDRLWCRIWSFEVNPDPKTALTWEIENDRGERISASVEKGGEALLTIDGKAGDSLMAYLFVGEDLQGEYWGGVMSMPLDMVLSFLEKDNLKSTATKMALSRKGLFSSSVTENFIIPSNI